ncbi:MAG TPA: heavy metal-associated domain-containing protein [Ignavibacteria bacterium]|nr:heavy metal-associated domain-containing protein [Ignavibacteria bacterium]
MIYKKIKIISKTGHLLLIVLMTALIIGLLPVDNLKAKTADEITVDITLPTIQCGMCESNISNALDKVKGVKSYSVDLDGKKVTVTSDDAITTVSKIEKAISKAGYGANNKKADKKAYDKLDECCKVQ